jgi:3D (Asp-Asp-Asp) domain-containing protein
MLATLKRRFKGKAKHIALALFLMALVVIPSSAKQVLILGRFQIVYSGRVTATAYNSMESQCDSTPWITASGTRCREGVIAANHLPIGTKVIIEGMGPQIFIVEDRMNRRYNKRIDIWFRHYDDALRFGKRTIKYHVVEESA